MGMSDADDPLLQPAALPPMLDSLVPAGQVRYVAATDGGDVSKLSIRSNLHLSNEALGWGGMLRGNGSVTIPPRTHRRVIVDLENYYCAYHELTTSGGAGSVVSILWQESLFLHDHMPAKGNRDEIEGKLFIDIVATAEWTDRLAISIAETPGYSAFFTLVDRHAARFYDVAR